MLGEGTLMRRVRLVVADRRPIVRRGFASLFAGQTDFEVVASCPDGASCLAAIRKLKPDVVLLEDGFSDVRASEMLATVKAEDLATRLVFFTASVSCGDLAAAIATGACSAISMRERPETLLQSLRLEPPHSDRAPAGKDNVLTVLNDQERRIVRLVGQGWSNRGIARQLNVSLGVIKGHLDLVSQKLEINDRTELAALAQRHAGIGALAALIFAALDDAQAANPNAVNAGHMATETFTVLAVDGTTEVITIIVNRSKELTGASDTAARAAIKARGVANAAASTSMSTPKLCGSGVDVSGSMAAINVARPSSVSYGAFTTAALAIWAYALDFIHSPARALDLGDSLADVSTLAAANGTRELATLTTPGSVAGNTDVSDTPAFLNHGIYDQLVTFGTSGVETIGRGGDEHRAIDAHQGEETASGAGEANSHAISVNDAMVYASGTVNALEGKTIDQAGFGAATVIDAPKPA
jgi:VCBS repeat-containing protein